MNNIADFRILSTDLGEPVDLKGFCQNVNEFLAKGYTIKGGVMGSIGKYKRISQAVVKYRGEPDETHVVDYDIIWTGASQYGAHPMECSAPLERFLLSQVEAGWSLYGDTMYSRDTDDYHRSHYYAQILVKYRVPTLSLI